VIRENRLVYSASTKEEYMSSSPKLKGSRAYKEGYRKGKRLSRSGGLKEEFKRTGGWKTQLGLLKGIFTRTEPHNWTQYGKGLKAGAKEYYEEKAKKKKLK